MYHVAPIPKQVSNKINVLRRLNLKKQLSEAQKDIIHKVKINKYKLTKQGSYVCDRYLRGAIVFARIHNEPFTEIPPIEPHERKMTIVRRIKKLFRSDDTTTYAVFNRDERMIPLQPEFEIRFEFSKEDEIMISLIREVNPLSQIDFYSKLREEILELIRKK